MKLEQTLQKWVRVHRQSRAQGKFPICTTSRGTLLDQGLQHALEHSDRTGLLHDVRWEEVVHVHSTKDAALQIVSMVAPQWGAT